MAGPAVNQESKWNWPGTWPEDPQPEPSGAPEKPTPPQFEGSKPTAHSRPKRSRRYGPRTCRICFETVLPTFQPTSSALPDVLQSQPSVAYISEDPELGRLISPCKCKGSSRYVHEGCLQAWRHADPEYGRRNYWDCPTCGFRYRLERMRLGRWVSSQVLQFVLTFSILFLTMFLLGFIADPIINLYLDPYTTVSSVPLKVGKKTEPVIVNDGPTTWTEHFLKGMASLGLLSFVKVLWMLGPSGWWNLRNSGLIGGGGGGRAGTGRDRLANISWLVVLIGVGTFLWGVYKGVRAWSRRLLEKAGERVQDVQADDDDESDKG